MSDVRVDHAFFRHKVLDLPNDAVLSVALMDLFRAPLDALEVCVDSIKC